MSIGAALTVRKTEQRDRGALIRIIEGTPNLNHEERECAIELLDIYLGDPGQKDYSFLAAVGPDDGPAGYACYGKRPLTDAVYDLYWIVVDGAATRKGTGRLLIDSTCAILKGLGARMLIAETSGLPVYGPARSFYLKCGFTEEARIREFYKRGDDIVFYIKRFENP